MQLSKVQKRLEQLENTLMDLGARSTHAKVNHDLPALMRELSVLAQDAAQIENRAITRGDDETALDAMREVCRIVELIARLDGQLNERSTTNILNVNIDHDTARRIAEAYAKRHTTTE